MEFPQPILLLIANQLDIYSLVALSMTSKTLRSVLLTITKILEIFSSDDIWCKVWKRLSDGTVETKEQIIAKMTHFPSHWKGLFQNT